MYRLTLNSVDEQWNQVLEWLFKPVKLCSFISKIKCCRVLNVYLFLKETNRKYEKKKQIIITKNERGLVMIHTWK